MTIWLSCLQRHNLEVLIKSSRDEHHFRPGKDLAGANLRVRAASWQRLARRQCGGVAVAQVIHIVYVGAEYAVPGRGRSSDDVIAAPDRARLLRDRLRREVDRTRRSARHVKLNVVTWTVQPVCRRPCRCDRSDNGQWRVLVIEQDGSEGAGCWRQGYRAGVCCSHGW